MLFFALFKEAVSALRANALRSSLTILGMVVGVTSVIAIVSVVEGLQTNLEQVFQSMGQNTFMVTRFGVGLSMEEYLERRKRKKLTRELIPVIKRGCPDCEHVGAEGYASDHIKYGAERMRWVSIQGQTPNVMDMQDMDVEIGRYLSDEDDYRRAKVAFLGYAVYENLFVNEDPIGKKIRVGRDEYTVIGVARELGGLFGEDMDEYIAIPLSTLQKNYPQPGDPVNLIVSAKSREVREAAIDQVRVSLRSARQIPYGDDEDFTIMTPDAILSFINDFTRMFRVLLISLPLLSIVVGGIVIMNIMMISVTERTREIGIRKSIGAGRRAILLQFLWESVVLSLIGGLLGVGFGVYLGSVALSSWMDIDVPPTMLAIGLGFGISTGVGLFFGIYPAMKAARLDPIKALSYE